MRFATLLECNTAARSKTMGGCPKLSMEAPGPAPYPDSMHVFAAPSVPPALRRLFSFGFARCSIGTSSPRPCPQQATTFGWTPTSMRSLGGTTFALLSAFLATGCAGHNRARAPRPDMTLADAGRSDAGTIGTRDGSTVPDAGPGFDGSAVPELDGSLSDAGPAFDGSSLDMHTELDASTLSDAGCIDCRGLYPIGPAVRVCDGLSTDPDVYAGEPELAAGEGTFAVSCVPRTTAAASVDTPWRVDLIGADGTPRGVVPLDATNLFYATEARVVFAHGRFVTASEFDCDRTLALYRGCTMVRAFLPDGSDVQRWPLLEAFGGSQAERSITTLGSNLIVATRGMSASDHAWSLGLDLSALSLGYLPNDGGTGAPLGLELRETALGFARFSVSSAGAFFTPFSVAGARLAPTSSIAAFATSRMKVVVEAEGYLVSLSNGAELLLLRLDLSGAELGRATVPLPGGGADAHALHVADGLAYLVHATVRDDFVRSLTVSVFDADLTYLPERSGPLFDGSPAFEPTIARDPMTGTHAIAYRVTPVGIEFRRFSHRPE